MSHREQAQATGITRLSRLPGGVDHILERFETIVLAYGVLLMAINTIANVFGRNVFQRSLYFTEEINQFLIVLVTFVGLSYAVRKGRHIRMTAIYDHLADPLKKALMILICAVTASIMFVLAYYSFFYIVGVAESGRLTPALRIPVYITYVWVPVGFAIAGIQYALTIIQNLRREEVYISYSEIDQYHDEEEVNGV